VPTTSRACLRWILRDLLALVLAGNVGGRLTVKSDPEFAVARPGSRLTPTAMIDS